MTEEINRAEKADIAVRYLNKINDICIAYV